MTITTFIKTVSAFKVQQQQCMQQTSLLLESRDNLIINLQMVVQNIEHNSSVINEAVSTELNKLSKCIHHEMMSIKNRWDDKQVMLALSKQYEDRLIILAYGKFNVGKSAFINFITEQFPAQQVKYFYLQNGVIKYAQSTLFIEGETETTAQVQGVEIGDNLLLLDSPGLHSVTAENEAIARVIIDSADILLWLTSSASPGQVQELESLKTELQTGKILLPVIACSDKVIESVVDGQLVKQRVNKDSATRALQEQDLVSRMSPLMIKSKGKLHSPISISVKMQQQEQANSDLSGMNRLFTHLLNILKKQGEIKLNKAQMQVNNHINQDVKPAVSALLLTVNRLILDNQQLNTTLEHDARIFNLQIASEITLFIPNIAHAHLGNENKAKIISLVLHQLQKSIDQGRTQLFGAFQDHLHCAQLAINSTVIADIRDIEITITHITSQANNSFLGDLIRKLIPLSIADEMITEWIDSLFASPTQNKTYSVEKLGEDNSALISSLIARAQKIASTEIEGMLTTTTQLLAQHDQKLKQIRKIMTDYLK